MADENMTGEMPAGEAAVGQEKQRHPWRSFMAWLLIVLGCLSAMSGTAALWMKMTALDTDTFVSTVGPLVKDEAVAKAVSKEAVKALFEQLDLRGQVGEKLPSELEFLAEPVTGGLEAVAQKLAQGILQSGAFQSVWDETLRLAHRSAMSVLTGADGVGVTPRGEVVLDLGALVNDLKDKLVAEGVVSLKDVKVDEDAAKVVLFTSDDLGAVKSAVDLLDLLAWVLPFLAIAFFAGAILIAADRHKALLGAGAGLAVAMAVSLIMLVVARSQLLGQVKDIDVRSAATVVWNGLFAGLVKLDIGLLVIGVVAGAAALIAGPYRWAISLRSWVAGLFKRGQRA